jgi:hypothetical protein
MQAILTSPVPSGTSARPTTLQVRTARVVETLLVLFLLVDGAGKVLRLAPYVEGTARVGYPAGSLVPLGVILIASTVLYALRRTSVLGVILLTGYLGGAIATHVRMGEPFVMPTVFAVLLWACLYARDASVRALVAPRPHPGA